MHFPLVLCGLCKETHATHCCFWRRSREWKFNSTPHEFPRGSATRVTLGFADETKELASTILQQRSLKFISNIPITINITLHRQSLPFVFINLNSIQSSLFKEFKIFQHCSLSWQDLWLFGGRHNVTGRDNTGSHDSYFCRWSRRFDWKNRPSTHVPFALSLLWLLSW